MDNESQFCSECGFKMDKGFGFCPKCGTKVPSQMQEPVSNTPPLNQVDQNCNMGYFNNHIYDPSKYAPQYPSQYNQYQPYQYPPPRKNSKTVIIIAAVVIGILALSFGGYFGVKLLLGKLSDKNTDGMKSTERITDTSESKGVKAKDSEPEEKNTVEEKESKPKESTSAKNEKPPEDKREEKQKYIEDPKIYLPKPFVKYTFKYSYPDGDSGNMDVVTGVIPEFSIVTSVELIQNSEAFTQHFVGGPDGVYVFSDDEFNKRSSLWLPFNVSMGDSIDGEGISRKILELEASCDLGYKKLDNCLVMEVNHIEVGVSYICYIAPGLGTVLVKDKANGAVVTKLLSETTVSEKEANDIVKRFSPNVMSTLN